MAYFLLNYSIRRVVGGVIIITLASVAMAGNMDGRTDFGGILDLPASMTLLQTNHWSHRNLLNLRKVSLQRNPQKTLEQPSRQQQLL